MTTELCMALALVALFKVLFQIKFGTNRGGRLSVCFTMEMDNPIGEMMRIIFNQSWFPSISVLIHLVNFKLLKQKKKCNMLNQKLYVTIDARISLNISNESLVTLSKLSFINKDFKVLDDRSDKMCVIL